MMKAQGTVVSSHARYAASSGPWAIHASSRRPTATPSVAHATQSTAAPARCAAVAARHRARENGNRRAITQVIGATAPRKSHSSPWNATAFQATGPRWAVSSFTYICPASRSAGTSDAAGSRSHGRTGGAGATGSAGGEGERSGTRPVGWKADRFLAPRTRGPDPEALVERTARGPRDHRGPSPAGCRAAPTRCVDPRRHAFTCVHPAPAR